uniref:RING-type E3 ubiquitin transferase n=1 Tax=Parascaris univalens TaxID=6257 RepID=A0A915AQF0_PARUN
VVRKFISKALKFLSCLHQMAPAGQGALWSEVLCCPVCSQLFGAEKQPVNLPCGHSVCRVCLFGLLSHRCPVDQTQITLRYADLPVNWALLSILDVKRPADTCRINDFDEGFLRAEAALIRMSSYLRKTDSERGGSVWSEELSRPVQRKLLTLLCFQLLEEEGRQKAVKTARALAERILSELVIAHQNTSHISSNLWSAVRARGCQFLGPAMQEEVLRLILLTLSEGALIARKTLVMYIVQTLAEDYPQVSKTCVGHVVQLLYRASCFNVMKRDGESSLMQLKTEFRDYDSLRREHDAQIVQVALEAGLRISPDQWSSLLYGDQSHRSHMQSIIDKLQSPQALGQLVQELLGALQRNSDPDTLIPIIAHFECIASFDPLLAESPSWSDTVAVFESLGHIVDAYVRFMRKRNEQRSTSACSVNSRRFANGEYIISGERCNDRRYKTRLCRDAEAGRACPRGMRCTYAHSHDELRQIVSQKARSSVPRLDGSNIGSGSISCLLNVQPPNAQPLPNPTMSIIPMRVPPPPNPNTPVIDPRHPLPNENGAFMPLSMPVVPVVIPGGQSVDPNIPNATVPLPPSQIANARIEHVAEPMAPAGTVVMMARGGGLPTAAQPVMMSAVWPTAVSHAQTVPAALLPPSNVQPMIPVPIPRPPPSQISITPNGAGWMHTCGNGQLLNDASMQYSVPYECVDPHWRALDDSRCAIPFPPATAVDAKRYMKGLDSEDEEQLMMRRREIISRLADLHQRGHGATAGEETLDEDDLQSHVSYTVASSVLYDEKETTSSNALQLPPLPLRFNNTPAIDDTFFSRNHLGEATAISTTVLTVCPPCIWSSGAAPATVQAPCTIMQVKDTINQPLPTPAIQRPHMPPLSAYEVQDPSCIAEHLPPVIRPLPATPRDPQNVVSATLDRIVDVRERMNDVEKNGGMGCSVEKQQLKVELNIVSRQIQSLDQQTKQSCLLRELEAVDKKIEHLNIHC